MATLNELYKASQSVTLSNAYDISTYNTANPDYLAISVATNIKAYNDEGVFIGAYPFQSVKRNEVLDPVDNYTIGTGICKIENLCVPALSVPKSTSNIISQIKYDSDNNVITPEDIKISGQVKNLADLIANLPTYDTPTFIPLEYLKNLKDIDLKSKFSRPDLPNDYTKKLTKIGQELTTQESVPCRPETPPVIPKPKDFDINNPELKDLEDKLKKLLNEPTLPEEKVSPVSNNKLTERVVDGNGTFDWLASALFNQLENSVNKGLISKQEVRDIYSKGIQTTLQTSAQFLIQNEQTYWVNLAAKNQIHQANTQALLAKAELLMLPVRARLEHARLDAELKKLKLIEYQIELEKQKIPQIVAETDHIREQSALVCQQKKLAIEQLKQAELDRQRKEREIDLLNIQHQEATIALDITKEKVVQSKHETELMIVNVAKEQQQVKQLEVETKHSAAKVSQTIEQTKMINAQKQNALKDITLKDAQLIQMRAQLKLQAQQLLKERHQKELITAQVATAYANISLIGQQIKASQAQYSDTIDGQKVAGVIGAKIAVNKAQAMGFERDSYYKFFSQIQAGWTAKKTADLATLSPNAFNALGLDRAINWYATKYFSMPDDIFKMPDTYRDYLSDAEMDGTEATPSTSNANIKKKSE